MSLVSFAQDFEREAGCTPVTPGHPNERVSRVAFCGDGLSCTLPSARQPDPSLQQRKKRLDRGLRSGHEWFTSFAPEARGGTFTGMLHLKSSLRQRGPAIPASSSGPGSPHSRRQRSQSSPEDTLRGEQASDLCLRGGQLLWAAGTAATGGTYAHGVQHLHSQGTPQRSSA